MCLIVGTGRSGTHWLAKMLARHPQIVATIEEQPVFDLVTTMAVHPAKRRRLMPRLARRYRKNLRRAAPAHYVDKSHPALWIAEDLVERFPNTRFLGIVRNPFAVAASTKRHEGVRGWLQRWESLPLPSRFLGVTNENRDEYARMGICGRSTMRWIAHAREWQQLEKSFPDRIFEMRYEDLIADPDAALLPVTGFLELDHPPEPIPANVESLDRWRSQLEPSDIREIRDVLSAHCSPDLWASYAAAEGRSSGEISDR